MTRSVHRSDRDAGLVLGIDTATRFLALAVVRADGEVLAESAEPVGREHAALIVPRLEELLTRAGVAATEVSSIAVGVGPGSYTGLRIGLATAKGLAAGWRVPLAGSDTLAAIAATGLQPEEQGIAAIDARRGSVYFGIYRRSNATVEVVQGPAKAARAEVATRYPGIRLLEDLPPSAAFHARNLDATRAARAVYL